MYFSFPAIFTEEKDAGGFSVEFPDLPGCLSQGDDFSDALKNAREAMSLYIEAALEEGKSLCPASDMKDISPGSENESVHIICADI